jgi:hypothetical protein
MQALSCSPQILSAVISIAHRRYVILTLTLLFRKYANPLSTGFRFRFLSSEPCIYIVLYCQITVIYIYLIAFETLLFRPVIFVAK